MRAHAYAKAVAQAAAIPDGLPELQRYFNDGFSPRGIVLNYITKKARADEKLYDCELLAVLHDVQAAHAGTLIAPSKKRSAK